MNEIITKIIESEDSHIYQGEFIKNVEFIEDFNEKDGNIEISIINFPLVVALTQECDSTQDYKNRLKEYQKRKETEGREGVERNPYLLSIMVAPVYLLDDIKAGKHLEHLGISCRTISSNEIKKIKQNADARYHYMKIEVLSGKYIEYIVDFKQYFTVNVDKILQHKRNKENIQFVLGDLFKESLSQRFSNYLSRIGLPETEIKEEE
ncbi:MAG: hypothetical protein IKV94_04870 [Clostridia bacterium]|nr:hypothetical protein [Clostridia bacterium]